MINGAPDPKHVATSYVEGQNLTMRWPIPFYPADECLFEKNRKSRVNGEPILYVLQLRADASDAPRHVRDGTRECPIMFGPLKRLSVFAKRPVGLGVLLVIVGVGSVSCATYRAWRYPCISHERGLRGEVMRSADGKLLYFNGTCWTARPMPPTDTPF